MESSSIRSRKRKQRASESDPFGGIFTRSRSQIYFHRHRSGYARADSNRSRNIINSLEGKLKQQQQQQQQLFEVSVKDLRARRVFSRSNDVGEADLEQLDANNKNDGNPKLLGVSENSVGSVDDFKANSENIVKEAVVVQMTPLIDDTQQKHDIISVSVSVADTDTKGLMNKTQSLVTSLRGRKKVFKSPTSFNYRRLLPYLMDSGSDDSSSFEIIEATLPNGLKSSNPVTNMVDLKDEGIGSVSGSSKLADGLMNNDKSCEKQSSNSVNAGLVSAVESSDVVQKSQEDVLNDTLECEQMTPPDSNIYGKSKTNEGSSAVLVKATSTRALKSCSRQKLLQTPTSFSHRRLLPFLMSVAEDYSCPLKDDQSLKLEKAIEQNQQPPIHSLVQDEKSTTADEASNSPTSTLIPVDASIDITKSVALVSNDNILDANTPDKDGSGSSIDTTKSVAFVSNDNPLNANASDKESSGSSIYTTKSVALVSNDNLLDANAKEGGGSISQLEVKLQVEAVKFDGCIKMEQSPPKINLKCVEDATSKAAPLSIEQSGREDHLITVKESPFSNATPLCIEQSYSEDRQITVKESPQQYPLQISEPQGRSLINGILKRTPRGCRGICNCLNCTSFRLHAERSFEFSKNQMHDAEEVALELINDLTCLRNLLETTSSYSSSLDVVKEKQVKEACAKALYKEQEARARLAQMNEDLSIHCRSMNLMRPKVTFANKIEEKLISKDRIYGKKSV